MSDEEPKFSSNPAVNDILKEMSGEDKDKIQDSAEKFAVSVGATLTGHVKSEIKDLIEDVQHRGVRGRIRVPLRDRIDIEVSPGLKVPKHLIEDAVNQTSSPAIEEVIEKRHKRMVRDAAELKADLAAGQKVLQEMAKRLTNPVNLDEKYVSFDAMPAPVQRLVKAYMEAEAANLELNEAIQALAKTPLNVMTAAARAATEVKKTSEPPQLFGVDVTGLAQSQDYNSPWSRPGQPR